VDEPHHERAEEPGAGDAAEPAIQVVASVPVPGRRRPAARHPVERAPDVAQAPQAERDEHQRHRHLHRETERGRDHDAEDDDDASDHEDRDGMADAPHGPRHDAGAQRPLSRDDRADGDDVVGVGGVAHSQKEAEEHVRGGGDHVRGTAV
jgi:hypothetical protein